MPNYLTPGIYVEEVSTGSRPIEAVGTSTAGFVGVAPAARTRLNELVWVNNWSQFAKEFAPPGSQSTPLSHAVFGFFQNGGGRCCVVNVGPEMTLTGGGSNRKGLDLLEMADEVAIVAAPGCCDAASYDALLTHCEKLKDRVAILDAPESVSSIDTLTKVAVATATSSSKGSKGKEGEGPAPGGDKPGGKSSGLRPRQSDGGYGAFYYPWITVKDPSSPKDLVDVPPSGHIAGIYARTDATRGVHKAPANEIIRGALNVNYQVTREEQGALNPNGVNCIRFFPGQGIRVFGARTVAESSNEWRYLNVRRLYNMIEKSIAGGTNWTVFEPNDRPLWKAIRRDVSAFLTLIWRQGALMGKTPEEAFFVQCDEETNTQETRDAGQVVTLVGAAPVKPAEFVIFRIGQWTGGTQTEENL